VGINAPFRFAASRVVAFRFATHRNHHEGVSMPFQTNPEVNIDVRRVEEVLGAAVAGDIIDYGQLSKILGRNVQNGARAIIQRAVKRQLKDGRLWLCIRKVGYRLAQVSDALPLVEHGRLKVYRTAKREALKLATVDYDALDRDQRTAVLAAQSMYGAVAAFTKADGLKRIEGKIAESESKALPLARTIEAFQK
jgi:hypothetical protein